MGMDDMIAAYVNEYGQELANELTGTDIVEGEVIEGDDLCSHVGVPCKYCGEGGVINNEQEAEAPGRTGEDDGLDSSEEE